MSARYLQYIEQFKDVAIAQRHQFGIPASITLAQGLLESNAGRSYLATRGNNHFGIKCHNSWKGPAVTYDDTLGHDCYRQYGAPEDSYLDHSLFLKGRRYAPLYELDSTDYRGWAEGLRTCGYAEDPAYPAKLINLIEQYELHRYDTDQTTPVQLANKEKKKDKDKDKKKEKEKKAKEKAKKEKEKKEKAEKELKEQKEKQKRPEPPTFSTPRKTPQPPSSYDND